MMISNSDKNAFDDFLPSGKFAIGANYWASKNATKMWREWDEESVEQDLVEMEKAGLTMLRVFPNWADFQPIVEIHQQLKENEPRETVMFLSEERRPDTPAGYAGVDERMMERFEAFCNLAEKHGFKLIVCLMNGQMTFRIIQPPAFEGKNIYSDPYALKWEGRFADYFVRRTRHLKAIAAWECGDEVIAMERPPQRDSPEFWMRYINDIIRRADPTRPVIGQNGLWLEPNSGWNVTEQSKFSDYLTTHPYGMWGNVYLDDFNGIRSSFFCASQTLALEQIGGVPAFVEEHGARRAEQTNRRNLAKYLRGALWNMWAADCKAMLWWCSYDQAGMDFPPYNWPEPYLELGAWKRDRTPTPVVKVLSQFAAMQKKLPFESLPKAETDAVFIVQGYKDTSDMVNATYVLARQAGIFPEYQTPYQPIRDAKTYFLPSAWGRGGLPERNWVALKEKISKGATLYISMNDTFLDDYEEVFGIEVAHREQKGGTDICDFGDFKLEVPYGVKRRFNALTAETLAKNQEGEGVFFRNRYGKGTVYSFIYPVEDIFYGRSGMFDKPLWQVYRKVCPVQRVVETGNPFVNASEHRFADGRIASVIVNNSPEAVALRPIIADGFEVTGSMTDDPSAASWNNGELRMEGNSGLLLICSRSGC